MITPLLDDGSPAYDNQLAWPGPAIIELPEDQWPTDRNSLLSWANSRAEVHFDRCWEAAVDDWEASPNRKGSVEDADPEEARKMVRAGLRLHIDQVEACLNAQGGPGMESWRAGEERGHWPPPDG